MKILFTALQVVCFIWLVHTWHSKTDELEIVIAEQKSEIDSLQKGRQVELSEGGMLINGELFSSYDIHKSELLNTWRDSERRHQVWLEVKKHQAEMDSVINLCKPKK